METVVVPLAYIIVGMIVNYIYQNLKTKNHAKQETQKQKEQKLFRFTRGNKALNPQQQQELFYLNERNLKEIKRGLTEMKNTWKNEHL